MEKNAKNSVNKNKGAHTDARVLSLISCILSKGDREAGGGESRPAEGDRDPAEGEGQAGVHAGCPQSRVQAAHGGAPPVDRAPAAAPAAAAVYPPPPDHAPQHGHSGSDEPGGGEARAGGRRAGCGQASAFRHQAHMPGR